jgi:hypothetical protein
MDNQEKGINNEMKSQSSDHPETEKTASGMEDRESNALGSACPDVTDMDEILTLARRYYATGFPNPQRRGCPPPGDIVKVVSRRRAPDQDLREHLFECSECFGEYRQALAQLRNEVVGWKRLASIFTLKRVSASAVILLVVFAGRSMWRKTTPDDRHEKITSSNPSGAQMPTPSPTLNKSDAPLTTEIAKTSVKRRVMVGKSRSSGRAEPSLETIEVDLDNYPAFRRSQEARAPFVLPGARANLILRLPETGAAGIYTVSLIDAFGSVLLSEPAVSRDGAKLPVKLDLRGVTPRKYRLRLSRKGEAPAYYDVIIRRR